MHKVRILNICLSCICSLNHGTNRLPQLSDLPVVIIPLVFLLSFQLCCPYSECSTNDHFQSTYNKTHSDKVTLPASCVGVEDGYQWMKMLDGDDYPAVHQLCDNEYMVIDINEDSNVIDYFSSYTTWHHSLGGTEHRISLNYSLRI